MPVSLLTTSAISSSVWRLPFINASTSPLRTISTAFAAEVWLCGVSTSCRPVRSSPPEAASALMRASGPTRDWFDDLGLGRFDCAAQGGLVARMRHRRAHRRQRMAGVDQRIVLFVPARFDHPVHCTSRGYKSCKCLFSATTLSSSAAGVKSAPIVASNSRSLARTLSGPIRSA